MIMFANYIVQKSEAECIFYAYPKWYTALIHKNQQNVAEA